MTTPLPHAKDNFRNTRSLVIGKDLWFRVFPLVDIMSSPAWPVLDF